MLQNSSQQLDLSSMGKQHNISVPMHQKSQSSGLPASFASKNAASNSQRLQQSHITHDAITQHQHQ